MTKRPVLFSEELKVALRGKEMVMAPNSVKTSSPKEEAMVIKPSEVEKGRSMDMFAPAWVQESTQVLKSKTKVLTVKKIGEDDNPSNQGEEEEKEEDGEIVEDLELAEIDQVGIWVFFRLIKSDAGLKSPGSEIVSQSLVQGPSLKHPLNSSWTLWFYKNESRNWEENQRQVSRHNFILRPSKILYRICLFALCLFVCYLHLFFLIPFIIRPDAPGGDL